MGKVSQAQITICSFEMIQANYACVIRNQIILSEFEMNLIGGDHMPGRWYWRTNADRHKLNDSSFPELYHQQIS